MVVIFLSEKLSIATLSGFANYRSLRSRDGINTIYMILRIPAADHVNPVKNHSCIPPKMILSLNNSVIIFCTCQFLCGCNF